MKICSECKWYKWSLTGYHKCENPLVIKDYSVNVVTGETRVTFADIERNKDFNWNLCGYEGKLWEKKIPFYKKIFK